MTDSSQRVTAGVDTHRDQHVVAALDERGAELGVRSFPTTPAGHCQLLAWLRGFGAVERCGVEGTGAYGASLTRYLHAEDVGVVEVNRPNRQRRRRHGKSDPLDAIAAIGELVENDYPARVRELGEHMMGRLETLKEKHQVVGQITGKGLLIGIEYVRDRETHEPFPDRLAFAKKVDLACRERGLVTRPSTHVQVLAPPFISTREQLDEMVSIIDDAIAAATRDHAPELAGPGAR